MAVKGIFSSDSHIVGSRKGDFASALLRTEPTGMAPMLALSSGMESAPTSAIVVTWFEENHHAGRINVTNNAGTGTTLTVDDPTQAMVGMVFMDETNGEYFFVTAVTGNDLTVERGFAGTSVTALDGSGTVKPIQRLGTAFEEASDRPTAITNLGFPRFNYVQIFRNEWDVSRTAQAVEYYIENPKAKSKRDAALMHAEDIERSSIFGKKTLGVRNGHPFRTMDGIATQITTNVTAQSTSVSYTNLRDFLRDIYSRNIKGKPNERIAFCGNSVLEVIDTLVLTHGHMNILPGQNEFGMDVKRWISPFGTISLMTHPLFNINPVWNKMLLILHPGAIRYRWLRRTNEDNYDRDGTRAGKDADYGVITSELTVEYKAELTGGKFTGIDTAKTDTL